MTSSSDRSVVLLLIEKERDQSHRDSLQQLDQQATASLAGRDPRRSYDQHQLDAVLKACSECHRSFYFTDPSQVVCLGCQR